MKLEINRAQSLLSERSEAIMSHRGEQLSWGVALFEKLEKSTAFQPDFDIFEQLNRYWAEQVDMTRQDKIFDVYKRMRAAFDKITDFHGEAWDTYDLTRELLPLVAELYSYHPLEDIRHWYDFKSGLPVPHKLDDEYDQQKRSASGGTREKTYLKDDYKGLTVLAVAIRAMIPVWGEFILLTRREKGTALKEFYAFKLLAATGNDLYTSPPMEKLRIYVEASLPDKSTESAVLRAISSEDFPLWVLSLVVVRRLAVGDLRGLDPDSNLITFIFKYIGQKVKSHDNSFMGLVKPKQTEGQGQEGENNLSKLEGYKVKQEIPAGDIVIMSYSMQRHEPVIQRLCPDLDMHLLEQSLVSVRALDEQQIKEPQIVLMQWMLKPVIPPRGLLHLSKKLVLEGMAITQAVLWHQGHYELAGLVSAIAQSNDEGTFLTGSDSRARIPADLAAQLQQLYPHVRRPTGKQQKTQLPKTTAELAITKMMGLFSQSDWRLTLPAAWVGKLTGSPTARRYSTPHEIKIKLANLSIQLATRKPNP